MTNPSYFDRYKNLAFSRDDNGVLTMRFHTDGGPIIFTGQTHEDLPVALEEIAADEDNRAMVLTGTGDVFMDQIDGPSLGDMTKPVVFERVRSQGIKILARFPSLPFPVVGVANGPATVHSEYLLLSDIHIASERATYGDLPHPTFGIAAGDGLQVVWEEVVGMARTKWLLWTGENIDAATAMECGGRRRGAAPRRSTCPGRRNCYQARGQAICVSQSTEADPQPAAGPPHCRGGPLRHGSRRPYSRRPRLPELTGAKTFHTPLPLPRGPRRAVAPGFGGLLVGGSQHNHRSMKSARGRRRKEGK